MTLASRLTWSVLKSDSSYLRVGQKWEYLAQATIDRCMICIKLCFVNLTI